MKGGGEEVERMEDGQIKHLLEKAKSDKQLQSELQSASDAQQVVEIAKNSGISISLEELKELENQELETGMKGFYSLIGTMWF